MDDQMFETPEGHSLLKWLRDNKILNMDLDTLISRATLLFLQFNTLFNKVTVLESKINQLRALTENNARILRKLQRT